MKAVEKREPFFPFSEGHLSLMEDGFSIRSAGGRKLLAKRDSPFVSTFEGPRKWQISADSHVQTSFRSAVEGQILTKGVRETIERGRERGEKVDFLRERMKKNF